MSKALRPMKHEAHGRLWRAVDGAVRDAMLQHPEYFTEKGRGYSCRLSIAKRVVGSIISCATADPPRQRASASRPRR